MISVHNDWAVLTTSQRSFSLTTEHGKENPNLSERRGKFRGKLEFVPNSWLYLSSRNTACDSMCYGTPGASTDTKAYELLSTTTDDD
ncbi:MAG: hypothetical protein HYY80_01280 [Chloroflexi bacterium]|nr:hypothetical protein [Chloroflexota bacterium]